MAEIDRGASPRNGRHRPTSTRPASTAGPEHGADPRAERIVFADWVTRWEQTSLHLRPSSQARDDSYLRNHLLPRFGPMRLDVIGVLDIRKWVVDLNAKGLAPATVQKAYQTLSKVLRSAVDADVLAQSPCRGVDPPRIERNEMRFLTPPEIGQLAEADRPPLPGAQANAALYRNVIVRMRHYQPSIDYVSKRTATGMPKRAIIRCLKRALAREIYGLVIADHRSRIAAANEPAVPNSERLDLYGRQCCDGGVLGHV